MINAKYDDIKTAYDSARKRQADISGNFANRARLSLVKKLGLDPSRAYRFVGQYPVKIIDELIPWFLNIPQEVSYRSISQQAAAALTTGDVSQMEKELGATPKINGPVVVLNAIVFIAVSFAPQACLDEIVCADSKASA